MSSTQADFTTSQYQFAAYLRDPDNQPAPADIEPRRMAIYRELFYNNIEGFIANSFPILRKITADQAWHSMIRDFMIKHHCASPLFNEIAREFISYLENERDLSDDPIFIKELAHYEWVELALSILDVTIPAQQIAMDDDLLTLKLTLSPLAWLLVYPFPVHHIAPDFQPDQASEQPIHLLVYRDLSDQVTFLELNPVSVRLIELLKQGLTGQAAAGQIASELQHSNPELVTDAAKTLIFDWIKRGILIAA